MSVSVPRDIPHICHFLYTGRIFKFQILHLKITKIYPKNSKICSFFVFNLQKFTPHRIFYTGSARGARDKYEVCPEIGSDSSAERASTRQNRTIKHSNTEHQTANTQN